LLEIAVEFTALRASGFELNNGPGHPRQALDPTLRLGYAQSRN